MKRNDGKQYNKAFGQNFLTDENLLAGIVSDSGVTQDDEVLEIGTGAAALTIPLAAAAKRVVTYEIDESLADLLKVKLFGLDNVELVFGDWLKRKENRVSPPYKVAANLPYYVTTPILFDLVESDEPPESITIMVQKEVAERLTARAGRSDYGAVTAALRLYGEARIMRIVPAEFFTPRPKVDSAVIRIDRTHTFDDVDKRAVSRAIRAGFAMRRKTLVNNLAAGYGISKETAKTVLTELGFGEFARGETLSTEDYVRLSLALAALSQAK